MDYGYGRMEEIQEGYELHKNTFQEDGCEYTLKKEKEPPKPIEFKKSEHVCPFCEIVANHETIDYPTRVWTRESMIPVKAVKTSCSYCGGEFFIIPKKLPVRTSLEAHAIWDAEYKANCERDGIRYIDMTAAREEG
jgi:uncharacterized Zn-finger protein